MGKIFVIIVGFLLLNLSVSVTERAAPERVLADPATPRELFPLPKGFLTESDLDEKKPALATGGKMIKIRQGPFKVEPGKQLASDQQWIPEPQMPCKDCYLTAIQGGLEYEDGTPAELDTGAMLQHLIIVTGGRDLVCVYWNLPQPNRLYATGNERETVRVNHGGSRHGMYIGEEDFFALRFNIVNNGKKPLELYVVQKYEMVPRAAAEGYREVKTAWIDIGGCGGTLFSPSSGRYSLLSKVWPSTMEGKILFVQGHVHEGGLNTTLLLNKKPICISTPLYGRKPSSIDPFGNKHISDSSICTDVGELKKGDEVRIATHYDSTRHPYDKSMPRNGIESIMAVANIYIAV